MSLSHANSSLSGSDSLFFELENSHLEGSKDHSDFEQAGSLDTDDAKSKTTPIGSDTETTGSDENKQFKIDKSHREREADSSSLESPKIEAADNTSMRDIKSALMYFLKSADANQSIPPPPEIIDESSKYSGEHLIAFAPDDSFSDKSSSESNFIRSFTKLYDKLDRQDRKIDFSNCRTIEEIGTAINTLALEQATNSSDNSTSEAWTAIFDSLNAADSDALVRKLITHPEIQTQLFEAWTKHIQSLPATHSITKALTDARLDEKTRETLSEGAKKGYLDMPSLKRIANGGKESLSKANTLIEMLLNYGPPTGSPSSNVSPEQVAQLVELKPEAIEHLSKNYNASQIETLVKTLDSLKPDARKFFLELRADGQTRLLSETPKDLADKLAAFEKSDKARKLIVSQGNQEGVQRKILTLEPSQLERLSNAIERGVVTQHSIAKLVSCESVDFWLNEFESNKALPQRHKGYLTLPRTALDAFARRARVNGAPRGDLTWSDLKNLEYLNSADRKTIGELMNMTRSRWDQQSKTQIDSPQIPADVLRDFIADPAENSELMKSLKELAELRGPNGVSDVSGRVITALKQADLLNPQELTKLRPIIESGILTEVALFEMIKAGPEKRGKYMSFAEDIAKICAGESQPNLSAERSQITELFKKGADNKELDAARDNIKAKFAKSKPASDKQPAIADKPAPEKPQKPGPEILPDLKVEGLEDPKPQKTTNAEVETKTTDEKPASPAEKNPIEVQVNTQLEQQYANLLKEKDAKTALSKLDPKGNLDSEFREFLTEAKDKGLIERTTLLAVARKALNDSNYKQNAQDLLLHITINGGKSGLQPGAIKILLLEKPDLTKELLDESGASSRLIMLKGFASSFPKVSGEVQVQLLELYPKTLAQVIHDINQFHELQRVFRSDKATDHKFLVKCLEKMHFSPLSTYLNRKIIPKLLDCECREMWLSELSQVMRGQTWSSTYEKLFNTLEPKALDIVIRRKTEYPDPLSALCELSKEQRDGVLKLMDLKLPTSGDAAPKYLVSEGIFVDLILNPKNPEYLDRLHSAYQELLKVKESTNSLIPEIAKSILPDSFDALDESSRRKLSAKIGAELIKVNASGDKAALQAILKGLDEYSGEAPDQRTQIEAFKTALKSGDECASLLLEHIQGEANTKNIGFHIALELGRQNYSPRGPIHSRYLNLLLRDFPGVDLERKVELSELPVQGTENLKAEIKGAFRVLNEMIREQSRALAAAGADKNEIKALMQQWQELISKYDPRDNGFGEQDGKQQGDRPKGIASSVSSKTLHQAIFDRIVHLHEHGLLDEKNFDPRWFDYTFSRPRLDQLDSKTEASLLIKLRDLAKQVHVTDREAVRLENKVHQLISLDAVDHLEGEHLNWYTETQKEKLRAELSKQLSEVLESKGIRGGCSWKEALEKLSPKHAEFLRHLLTSAKLNESDPASPETLIDRYMENSKTIIDNLNGERISKELAEKIFDGLNAEEKAKVIEILKSRRSHLSLKGLKPLCLALANLLEGERLSFLSAHSNNRGEMRPAIKGLMLGPATRGNSRAYHFHKFTQIHVEYYRLEKSESGEVRLVSPEGHRWRMVQDKDRVLIQNLQYNEQTRSWESEGKPRPLTNAFRFVLMDSIQESTTPEEFRNILKSMQGDHLLVPEELVGPIDAKASKKSTLDFHRFALAEIDKTEAQKLAQDLKALARQEIEREGNPGQRQSEGKTEPSITDLQKVIEGPEHQRTEARLYYDRHANLKALQADVLEQMVRQDVYKHTVQYRNARDFYALCRQQHRENLKKTSLGPKILSEDILLELSKKLNQKTSLSELSELIKQELRSDPKLQRLLGELQDTLSPKRSGEKMTAEQFTADLIAQHGKNTNLSSALTELQKEIESRKHSASRELRFIIFENEGSGHFIHECYRRANGLDKNQFFRRKDLGKIPQNGEGLILMHLDEAVDFGEEGNNKCKELAAIAKRGKKTGWLKAAYVSTLFEFAEHAGTERSEITNLFKNPDVREHLPRENFLHLEHIPSLPNKLKSEGASACVQELFKNPQAWQEGGTAVKITAIPEVWTYLVGNNAEQGLFQLARATGHPGARALGKKYNLYKPFLFALPDYLSRTEGIDSLYEQAHILKECLHRYLETDERLAKSSKAKLDTSHRKETLRIIRHIDKLLHENDEKGLRSIVDAANSVFTSPLEARATRALADIKLCALLNNNKISTVRPFTEDGNLKSYVFFKPVEIYIPEWKITISVDRITQSGKNKPALYGRTIYAENNRKTDSINSGEIEKLLLTDLRKNYMTASNGGKFVRLAAYLERLGGTFSDQHLSINQVRRIRTASLPLSFDLIEQVEDKDAVRTKSQEGKNVLSTEEAKKSFVETMTEQMTTWEMDLTERWLRSESESALVRQAYNKLMTITRREAERLGVAENIAEAAHKLISEPSAELAGSKEFQRARTEYLRARDKHHVERQGMNNELLRRQKHLQRAMDRYCREQKLPPTKLDFRHHLDIPGGLYRRGKGTIVVANSDLLSIDTVPELLETMYHELVHGQQDTTIIRHLIDSLPDKPGKGKRLSPEQISAIQRAYAEQTGAVEPLDIELITEVAEVRDGQRLSESEEIRAKEMIRSFKETRNVGPEFQQKANDFHVILRELKALQESPSASSLLRRLSEPGGEVLFRRLFGVDSIDKFPPASESAKTLRSLFEKLKEADTNPDRAFYEHGAAEKLKSILHKRAVETLDHLNEAGQDYVTPAHEKEGVVLGADVFELSQEATRTLAGDIRERLALRGKSYFAPGQLVSRHGQSETLVVVGTEKTLGRILLAKSPAPGEAEAGEGLLRLRKQDFARTKDSKIDRKQLDPAKYTEIEITGQNKVHAVRYFVEKHNGSTPADSPQHIIEVHCDERGRMSVVRARPDLMLVEANSVAFLSASTNSGEAPPELPEKPNKPAETTDKPNPESRQSGKSKEIAKKQQRVRLLLEEAHKVSRVTGQGTEVAATLETALKNLELRLAKAGNKLSAEDKIVFEQFILQYKAGDNAVVTEAVHNFLGIGKETKGNYLDAVRSRFEQIRKGQLNLSELGINWQNPGSTLRPESLYTFDRPIEIKSTDGRTFRICSIKVGKKPRLENGEGINYDLVEVVDGKIKSVPDSESSKIVAEHLGKVRKFLGEVPARQLPRQLGALLLAHSLELSTASTGKPITGAPNIPAETARNAQTSDTGYGAGQKAKQHFELKPNGEVVALRAQEVQGTRMRVEIPKFSPKELKAILSLNLENLPEEIREEFEKFRREWLEKLEKENLSEAQELRLVESLQKYLGKCEFDVLFDYDSKTETYRPRIEDGKLVLRKKGEGRNGKHGENRGSSRGRWGTLVIPVLMLITMIRAGSKQKSEIILWR